MSGFAHYPVSKATLAAMMPHLEVASPQGVNVSTSVAQETNYCRLFPDHFSSLKMLTHLAAQARGTRRDVVAVLLRRRVSGEFDAIGGACGLKQALWYALLIRAFSQITWSDIAATPATREHQAPDEPVAARIRVSDRPARSRSTPHPGRSPRMRAKNRQCP